MKIVIADDHAVVRSGFSMILNYQEDMEVVATAADGIEAHLMVAKHQPDILLLDLSMPPGESGLIATGKISEDFPDTKILILTMYDDQEYMFHVLKNGASGYILKNAPDEELLSAIRMVYKGGTYIHPKMATSLVKEFIKKDQNIVDDDPFRVLSKREIEILPLVAKGYGNKDIAAKLFISVKTVEAHKAKIMEKLDLKSRPELVEYALKKKLLEF
ncbi:two component transcriptional regulator, LuxR family [Paenisporosarcina quisquiliarum]|jgi:two-component system response regulator NreC|uniref:Response regulator transcription factor n=1 Tax=Psychrobacillus psychrodurans TaxID=126157 RepID=A0A9X3R908_9BACI|nr:response regulator transcription factor [Psychrobacillus psychrodurans]SEM05746.1 two component transcriptional regulator, LuxR family [Paenisporosarcina quisquiliarum]MCK1999236.1 response regulator transcription factor [Psychrobacillus psychrodurans]MCZ8532396.1 response regulator transcription factor [Psychrobacillus psychrodurans]MCZ8540012.1 response regulator transcription factor [Psychrobacillus psychrodurans]SFM52144.1 two-component system, NarL family, response regulator NreC [Psyc